MFSEESSEFSDCCSVVELGSVLSSVDLVELLGSSWVSLVSDALGCASSVGGVSTASGCSSDVGVSDGFSFEAAVVAFFLAAFFLEDFFLGNSSTNSIR